jgi:alanine racemase
MKPKNLPTVQENNLIKSGGKINNFVMKYTSKIELSRSALKKNIDFLRSHFGDDLKISSVIKGNAYGHGIGKFVPMVEACGIDHFSVFSAAEAERALKVIRNGSNVMILGMIENPELEWAIQNDIEFYIFELDRLANALRIARQLGKPAKMHIEVETGMNRTGFLRKDLGKVVELLRKHEKSYIFQGLCTHYAGAESVANYVRVKRQIRKYDKIYKWFKRQGLIPKTRHTACSAASMSYPKTRMDMVRIGIMHYGFWPSRETFIDYLSDKNHKTDPLKRVIKWKSKVMSTKEVKTGEFVGYGTSYLAQENTKIAIVPVGYSYGFSRSLSNQGRVLIRGHRLSVIGTVNMNMIIVNVNECPEVRKDDEVVLIGDQEDLTISVASFSEFSNLLNYELLSRLPMNTPRVVVD